MTFLPNALSTDDVSYSGIITLFPFTGVGTETTGYNSIIVSIRTTTSSSAGALQIQFSRDNSTYTTLYSDTVSDASPVFVKAYPVVQKYYRIVISSFSSSITLDSRLSTSDPPPINSAGAFVNDTENRYDAFGKLRVVSPMTILDLRVPGQGSGSTSTQYLDNYIQYTFAGTGSRIASNSRTLLSVNATQTCTNQSRKYCTYQPGKSFLIKCTGVMDGAQNNSSGVVSRIGYFDDNNGLFFQYTADGLGTGTCVVAVRNLGVTTITSQSDWNIDKMDGTGTSGLRLDWTKAQLFVIDLEWLGVGRVRFGFYAYGRIQYCHEILNINILTVGPYTSNINLPIRYQLIGAQSGSGSLVQICSTVISEGGYEPIGRPFSISSANVSAPGTATEQYLLFLRGGCTAGSYYHQQILPLDVSITSTGVNDVFLYYIKLWLPESITSSTITWSDVNTNLSVSQYATSGTITGSPIIVDTQSASGRGSATYTGFSSIFTELLQLSADVNNNSAIFTISVSGNFGGGSKLYSTLTFSEIY